MSRGSTLAAAPRIGIFWCHRGAVLARSCEVREGVVGERFVDSPFDHVSSWALVRHAEHGRFRELAIRDYEEVPRGRVLYDRRAERFLCYLDRTVDSPATRAAVVQAFALVGQGILFRHDEHYTTDRQDLDRLFGD